MLASGALAQVPSPSREGPVAGPRAPFVVATASDLARLGYLQDQSIAAGESQSAFRLTTYVNAVHPLVRDVPIATPSGIDT